MLVNICTILSFCFFPLPVSGLYICVFAFFCVVLLFMSTEMDQKLFNVLAVLYDMCVLCKLLTSLILVATFIAYSIF